MSHFLESGKNFEHFAFFDAKCSNSDFPYANAIEPIIGKMKSSKIAKNCFLKLKKNFFDKNDLNFGDF